ncbi:amino acid ABC transporter ATP-binding protein [Rhizobium sp. NRK18]|jgi:polar amino acid transport system ATP-binding protein|uniref:amino acid ABC transporter ATP-binding protein n=1 Tax=Rhizobium sp. NRK18 TaxID=2964667 RepID=UPI0021C2E870|nr:amino acid ABC transporter ATP-binding protein [Rhizobium sp. NRK18]MCQ2005992.1 amino acid ABC transporter ATP-binding protein [Rhizobium sp. NRK18]
MTTPAIEVRNLAKKFADVTVLQDIDLEVAQGQVACLIGPSGSGKSTLLRCIAFLEEHSQGTISIDGQALGFFENAQGVRERLPASSIREVRSRIGMVFQQFNLWPHMTALGNVSEALKTVDGMKKAEAEEIAMMQLKKVGLEHRASHYPSQLSGGQQQRVAIARALARQPKIMLFDEATSALDPELTGEVLNVMRSLAEEGMTMVVVTHEIGFAASVANQINFLDHGKLLFKGPPSEVFQKPRHPRLEQFLDTYLDRGASALL